MQKSIGFALKDILASATAAGRSAGFVAALAFTLPQEGMYFEIVDGDDGGATCCGITQEDYNAYRSQIIAPSRSVEQITAREVADCYYRHYWAKMGCDNWQQPIAVTMFDAGVNTGIGEAAKFMQRALGVTPDGVLGPGTQNAEHAYVVAHGAAALSSAIIAQRQQFYRNLAAARANDAQFLAGWLARCVALESAVEAA